MRAPLFAAAVLIGVMSAGCGRVMAPSPEGLREKTVVVHVHASHRVAQLFSAVADRFEQSGDAQTGAFLRMHVSDSFGSGFLVRQDGRMYAITNRHVVDLAEEPEIEIEGGVRLAADVVYTHPVYDLAILAPRGGPWPEGMHAMNISMRPARDLDEVIATGHPGLNGVPSYQSTMGRVANSSLEIGHVTYIQHSAPIDPGSSGGPLLNDAGYVVGVNAGKAPGRDNVYVAVPAAALKEALGRAAVLVRARENPGWEAVALQLSCRELASEMAGDDLARSSVFAIGSDLVAERGFESFRFLETDARTTDADRAFFRAAFSREPVAMLRAAVALRLWAEAHDLDGSAVGCNGGGGAAPTEDARMTMQFSKRARESVWRFEQGQWRLAAIGGLRPVALPPAASNKAVAKDDKKEEKKDPASRRARTLPRK